MNTVREQKLRLRELLKRSRAQLSSSARSAASASIRTRVLALPEVRSAACVFCFVSSTDEVDTHLLIDELAAQSKQLLVPKILPEGYMIAARFSGWSSLAPAQLGILAPVSPIEYDGAVDVCITPGLGYSVQGQRLGYGRGYYDQWFRTHPAGCRIGIGFECQIVAELPVGEGDVALDRIITETRTVHVR